MNTKEHRDFSKFLPIILIAIVAVAIVGEPYVGIGVKSFFYSLSLTIKQGLIFTLPFLVFGFMLTSIAKMGRRSLGFVACLVPSICISNVISTHLSYLIGTIFVRSIAVKMNLFVDTSQILEPLWAFQLKPLIGNDWALLAGTLTGLATVRLEPGTMAKWLAIVENTVGRVIRTCFIPATPLFLFGFVLKLRYEHTIGLLCTHYSKILIVIFISATTYIFFLYFIFGRCRLRAVIEGLRHMFPAILTGFTTMSSAAAMPLTIMAVKKMTNDDDRADGLVPATVNVHLVGDCFSIPLMALGLMISLGSGFPNYTAYAPFVISFVLAKFAVAAVPGGGILVMLPILEKHLHFSPDMLSLITALYIIFDPLITGVNIFGNGAFAVGFTTLFRCRDRQVSCKTN
jgi:Na+/H+-dicarboxylate symporter